MELTYSTYTEIYSTRSLAKPAIYYSIATENTGMARRGKTVKVSPILYQVLWRRVQSKRKTARNETLCYTLGELDSD